MGLLNDLTSKHSIYKIFIVLTIGWILGLNFGKGFLIFYESKVFKPWAWETKPFIVNCYGPELTYVKVRDSVKFWTDRQEEILFIENSYIKELCKNKKTHHNGVIKIFKVRDIFFDSNETQAMTGRKSSVTTGIISANIYIRSGKHDIPYLLTHELGHAFGYTHVNVKGHIMHPITNLMGGKFWIP